jgi:hypothetical protein
MAEKFNFANENSDSDSQGVYPPGYYETESSSRFPKLQQPDATIPAPIKGKSGHTKASRRGMGKSHPPNNPNANQQVVDNPLQEIRQALEIERITDQLIRKREQDREKMMNEIRQQLAVEKQQDKEKTLLYMRSKGWQGVVAYGLLERLDRTRDIAKNIVRASNRFGISDGKIFTRTTVTLVYDNDGLNDLPYGRVFEMEPVDLLPVSPKVVSALELKRAARGLKDLRQDNGPTWKPTLEDLVVELEVITRHRKMDCESMTYDYKIDPRTKIRDLNHVE